MSAARAAIRSSTPETPAYRAGQLGVAFAQADRLGGTVYDLHARDDGSIDLLLAVPAGTGVDAAFASIVLRDLYRRQGRGADARGARRGAARRLRSVAAVTQRRAVVCALRRRRRRSRRARRSARTGARSIAPARCTTSRSARRSPSTRAGWRRRCGRSSARSRTAHLRSSTTACRRTASRRLDRTTRSTRVADRLARRREDPQTAAEDVVAEAVKRYRKRHSDDFFAFIARAS